jgi:hypothetical protein
MPALVATMSDAIAMNRMSKPSTNSALEPVANDKDAEFPRLTSARERSNERIRMVSK